MAEQRLIDANALALEPDEHNAMNGVRFVGGHRDGGRTIAMVKHALKKMIANAPTIDAVPVVHARWIEHVHVDEFGDCCYIDQECSHCHVTELFVDDGVRAFCPNCGAKMDGGAKE